MLDHLDCKIKNLNMQIRLFLSFYSSLFLHLTLILFAIAPNFKSQFLICGYHEVIEEKEKTLSFEFSMGQNPEESDAKKIDGKSEGNSDKKSETTLTEEQKEKLKKEGWGDLVDRLNDTKNLQSSSSKKIDQLLKNSDVADSYIQRERNYEDIIVKDVFPTLDKIEKPFEEEIKQAPLAFSKFLERNEIIEKFRQNNFDDEDPIKAEIIREGISEAKKQILKISPEEKEKYFDKTLTYKKEEQLNDFIEKFLSFDPNQGDLPVMFRDLYYKNLQRLAYNFSSDSTYFTIDYFQENLNKEDYLKNSMKLLSELKGTKTSIEILFTIENIYEIQSKAIQEYFQNQNLLKSKTGEIRIETIKRVLARYAPILNGKKLNNYEDIWNLYSKKKEEIMDYAIKTSPENYRIADAMFEKGRILFERGIRQNDSKIISNAISVWNKIGSQPSTGEFMNKKIHEQIQKDLEKNSSMTKALEMQINSSLQMRLFDHLTEKRIREDRLLWKNLKK